MPAARAAWMSQTLSPIASARSGSIEPRFMALRKTSGAGFDSMTSPAVVRASIASSTANCSSRNPARPRAQTLPIPRPDRCRASSGSAQRRQGTLEHRPVAPWSAEGVPRWQSDSHAPAAQGPAVAAHADEPVYRVHGGLIPQLHQTPGTRRARGCSSCRRESRRHRAVPRSRPTRHPGGSTSRFSAACASPVRSPAATATSSVSTGDEPSSVPAPLV